MNASGRGALLLHRLAGQHLSRSTGASASLSTWLWASAGPNLGISQSREQGQHTGQGCLFNHATSIHPIGFRSFQTSTVNRAKDYYEILGVPKTASDSELKKAFYKLAKQYHPDTNKGNKDAEKKFQEVSKAYDTLRDPEKRSMYDQVGPEAMESGGFGGFGSAEQGNPFGGFRQGADINAEEIFNMFFGGEGRPGRGGFQFYEDPVASGKLGHDIHTRIKVTFEEATKGGQKTFTIKTKQGDQTVSMHIPAGSESGQTFQMQGKGAPARDKKGTPGNLLVTLDVKRHPVFRHSDGNIHMNKSIDLPDAILGTNLRIPTLDGDVEIKLSPGTQHGDTLRMGGKGVRLEAQGMPHVRGDQIVHISLNMPTNLTSRQRELLEEFKQEEQSKKEGRNKTEYQRAEAA